MARFTAALLAALLTLSATAQDQAAPADPLGGPDLAEPADIPDVAWVRLAHFSPNAQALSVQLVPTEEDTASGVGGFDAVEYRTITDYVEVPAGNYAVTAEESEYSLEDEFTFARGAYYTIATVGMVLPSDVQAEQEEDGGGGFLGFFQNLFGDGQGDRDALALHFSLLEDDLTRTPRDGETLVRLVHAAPGTEDIDLAVAGEQGTLVNGIGFGEASRYASYQGGMEQLEVRLSGSRAATLDVATLGLQQGHINTVFVVGTPVEAAPVDVLGSSISPTQPGMAAGEDVAVAAFRSGESAGGGAADESEEEPAETEENDTSNERETGEGAQDDGGGGADGDGEEGSDE